MKVKLENFKEEPQPVRLLHFWLMSAGLLLLLQCSNQLESARRMASSRPATVLRLNSKRGANRMYSICQICPKTKSRWKINRKQDLITDLQFHTWQPPTDWIVKFSLATLLRLLHLLSSTIMSSFHGGISMMINMEKIKKKHTDQENSMTLEKEQMNNPLLLPFYANMTK